MEEHGHEPEIPKEPTNSSKKYKYDSKNIEAEEEYKNIKEFDYDKIPNHPVILCVAKRGSGKSYLLKYLVKELDHRFHYNEVYLFSKTADLQEGQFSYVPKKNIFKEYDEQKIFDIMQENEKIKKKYKKEGNHKNVLIIFDDMINERSVTNSKMLNEIATRGRHSNISLILLSQDLSSRAGFSPTIRKNVDLYISFDIYDRSTRELCSDCYLSKFDPMVGKLLLNKITISEPYMACFVLSRNKDTAFQPKRYSDYVFKYKAPDKKLEPFIVDKPYKVKELEEAPIVNNIYTGIRDSLGNSMYRNNYMMREKRKLHNV